VRDWIEWRTHEAERGAVSTGSQRWRSGLVAAIVVMATMGCGDGQQTDPRNLTYCGGTCWGPMCCAPSNDACPRLMPLQGSPCGGPTGVWCGYGCGDPYGASYHVAGCFEWGWEISTSQCDPSFSLDAGPMPDATADADAASDAALPDGS
jgi:hypothetical protein